MEKKFEIKFEFNKELIEDLRKIKTLSQFETEICKEGWLLFEIGNSSYGELPSAESINGLELLDVWFKYLKEVYLKLHITSKVVLDYWENPFDFFVFTRENDTVAIQYFKRILPIDNGIYQKDLVHEIKLLAETVIAEEDFFNTIKHAVNNFWNELIKINSLISAYAEEFYIK